MLELLTPGEGRTVVGDTIIDIDFTTHALGAKNVTDKTGRVWTRVGADNLLTEVKENNDGRFMDFNGQVYFTTPIDASLRLADIDFMVECEFQDNLGRSGSLFETGGWNSARFPGFSLSVNQFPGSYIQYFMMGEGTQFTRVMGNITNTLVWEKTKFIHKRTGDTELVVTRDVGEIVNYKVKTNTFGNGQTLMTLGGSITAPGTNLITTKIKSLKISKLISA